MTKACPKCGAVPNFSGKLHPRNGVNCLRRQVEALKAAQDGIAQVEDFGMLWREYALEKDENLDANALELKRTLRKIVGIDELEAERLNWRRQEWADENMVTIDAPSHQRALALEAAARALGGPGFEGKAE